MKGGTLSVHLRNDSPVLAKHVMAEVKFPHEVCGRIVHFTDGTLIQEQGIKSYWRRRISNGIVSPFFPFASLVLRDEFEFMASAAPDLGPPREEIELTIYADEMPPLTLVRPVTEAIAEWA